MSEDSKMISMCVPAEVEFLHLIRYTVRSVAKEFGFGAEDAAKIEMAADEACTNVMLHGYEEDSDEQSVYVKMQFYSDRMILRIIDKAKAFSPVERETVTVEEHLKKGKRGGLGIYIMRSFMDEVNHEYSNDGNQLELVKFLPASESQKAEAHP
ncbi:MAG: ATP-binding protein [Planctomycetota bacterium]|jgi:serine/threonine-protein kinase RsbW|nr:ATP-binding protein [Planctomycetota bacterium]MDP7131016.1 ATP-binding protein [Planctomycetota bacterium]MDP7254380.1 ATP-binding protein [Planctomycetota bacterium]